MIKAAAVCVFFAIVSAAAAVSAPPPEPDFCHGLDCPTFTTVTKGNGFDIREYPDAKWTSITVQEVSSLQTAIGTGFEAIFQYISGGNAASEKIEMTAPVRVEVLAPQGPYCKANVTTSFFLPWAFQNSSSIPKANNPDVFTNDIKDLKVAVLVFPGKPKTDSDITDQVAKLGALLDTAAIQYNKDVFVYAGYDSPFRVFDRHNEVWLYLL
jgi:hypothetical protein